MGWKLHIKVPCHLDELKPETLTIITSEEERGVLGKTEIQFDQRQSSRGRGAVTW